MSAVLKTLAAVCILWGVTAAMLIVGDLQKRGVRISFFWLRLYVPRYVSEYARLTREETGRPGPLFYHCVVPFILALVLTVVILAGPWR